MCMLGRVLAPPLVASLLFFFFFFTLLEGRVDNDSEGLMSATGGLGKWDMRVLRSSIRISERLSITFSSST